MTSSGTVSATSYPVNKIIEQALRRCGVASSTLTAEHLQVGRDNLFLMLSAWANSGVNLWEVREATIVLTAGTATYVLPAGAVDDLNVVYRRTDGMDLVLTAINRDTYVALANKTQTGQPTQYWPDRQIVPQITLWPVPDAAAALGSVRVWYHRHIEDPGQLTNTLDVPQRWLEAVVTGLAVRMAMELPNIDPNRVQPLAAFAEKAFQDASGEETDGTPVYVVGDLFPYSR